MQEFLKKTNDYTKLIQKLSNFGKSSPHAAYHCYVKGHQNKISFLSRTTPKTTDFLHHAEEIISNNLIPALTNRDCPDRITRRVLSLPVRNGGLAVNQPADYSRNYSDSQNLSAPLGDASSDLIILEQDRMKKQMHKERLKTATQKQKQIIGATNPDLSYALKLAREKGASSWLNALPIEKHGLWLTKLEFRDALCIRYGWDFKNVPSICACGSPFVLSHALHCPKGGYPIIRHNEIRDIP